MLNDLLMALLALLAALLSLPAWALALLVMGAWLGERRRIDHPAPTDQRSGPRGSLAVLVPAHNEARHIGATVQALRGQLSPGDRLVVVADNCSDATAASAREHGAEVLERHDTERRGKGYALAHGVAHLAAQPPAAVLVVDADCRLSPGAADRIARVCEQQGRPVQMLDLMSAPAGAGLTPRTLEFAMRVKNLVRPMGTAWLGDCCHLMGTGMALPWGLLKQAPLATGHVAEDMALGLALTRAGRSPCFLPEVRVSSHFAPHADALRAQKTRWEHGHLQVMQEHLLPLLALALRQGRLGPLALALDLMIPPLALYVLLLGGATLLACLLGLLPGELAALTQPARTLLLAGGLGLVGALALSWWRWGRDVLRPIELLSLPLYALWKVPVYLAYALGRRSSWVRGWRADPGQGERS